MVSLFKIYFFCKFSICISLMTNNPECLLATGFSSLEYYSLIKREQTTNRHKSHILNKEARHKKKIYAVGFHLYEAQEQEEQIYGDRS